MMDARHLELLVAVAETGNISRAARRLHLSQPAASQQMRNLEEAVGAELFERKSSPLRLTPAGRRLLEAAYGVRQLLEEARRDVARIVQGQVGSLRIAVECHSCFDWLMPAMDAFRERWPEVEMDLVSGFHADPVGLLGEGRADLVIVSQARARSGVVFHPLFRYEVFALVGKRHRFVGKGFLTARDFAQETLITYPIPDERLDVVREVLRPAGVEPPRRTTELTVAILQLVASGRGIAALPGWTVQPYLDRDYVKALRITRGGLQSALWAAVEQKADALPYMREFIEGTRRICLESLKQVLPFENVNGSAARLRNGKRGKRR
jgi:LysR family transcriptional regulator for metE and metH